MRQTGALERALTIRRVQGQTIRLNRQSMSVGLLPKGKVFYGKFHQSKTTRADLPVRKVVVFDTLAERKVEPTIHDYIMHGSRTTRR